MASLTPKTVIPFETYQRLLTHLEAHAPTDSWAAQLLSELEKETKTLSVLPSGSLYLDVESANASSHWN